MPSIIETFRRQVQQEFLPAFCSDPHRQYDPSGFKSASIRVCEVDAIDCMRAIETGVVIDTGGGRYRAVRSCANEVLFWEGLKAIAPRPITLWVEPVITIAAASRLHHDHGWPKNCIGLQSKKWGFDIVAYESDESDREYILGEVKRTAREAETLIRELHALSEHSLSPSGTRPLVSVNSSKKWEELLRREPKIVWVLGPDKSGAIFTLDFDSEGGVKLIPVTSAELTYGRVR